MKKLNLEQYMHETIGELIDIDIDDYVLSSDLIEHFEKNQEDYIRQSKSAQKKLKDKDEIEKKYNIKGD